MPRIGIKSGLKRAPTEALSALRFPSNQTESPRLIITSPMAFNPATYIWEVTPFQQNGYYTTFFWVDVSGDSFNSGRRYAGFHPYPDGGGDEPSTHKWEVSCNGNDYVVDDNANDTTVVKGVKYLQAATVDESGSNYVIKFYWNLPSLTKVITVTFPKANYSVEPPTPGILIGGAKWSGQTTKENLSGDFGRFKFMSAILSTTDINLEAANLSALQTAAGIANIWFGKKNWLTVDSLTCDYGTERSFEWDDAGTKATLVAA